MVGKCLGVKGAQVHILSSRHGASISDPPLPIRDRPSVYCGRSSDLRQRGGERAVVHGELHRPMTATRGLDASDTSDMGTHPRLTRQIEQTQPRQARAFEQAAVEELAFEHGELVGAHLSAVRL